MLSRRRSASNDPQDEAAQVIDEEQALNDLRDRLKQGLSIKDRKWMFVTYPKCFVGTECVKYLIESKEVSNEEEAIILGRMLIATNIIRHVEGDHDFKNEKLFYRFVEDEPSHGKIATDKKGKKSTWADHPLGGNNKSNKDKSIIRSSKDAYQLNENDTITTYEAKIAPLTCKYNQQLLNNVRPSAWINPTPKGRYNLIAIGAGAAGLISASSCAGIGGKSAIIEQNLFGGDCLNHGCIPSKALLKCAKVIENSVYRGNEFGLKFVNHEIDFPAIMQRMRRIRYVSLFCILAHLRNVLQMNLRIYKHIII